MRTAFSATLVELAEQDPRIFLIVGDLGFGSVEPFAKRFPNQFLNAGVAEQNMTSIAAGLALSGKIVFTYSIANFATLRCLEQIRNDVCYHNANVKIVAVGGGLAYGALGMTHHATEDLAILRALPRMTVIAPGDPVETEQATRAVVSHPGPCYLRLGRVGEQRLHASDLDFHIGKAYCMRNGEDLTIISTGGILNTSLEAAEQLARKGIQARVLSMPTVKPIDEEAIIAAAAETRGIITVEEHSVIGGLGGAVAEVLAESNSVRVPFLRMGLPSAFAATAGSQNFLREQWGLTANEISLKGERLLDTVEAAHSPGRRDSASPAKAYQIGKGVVR